MSKASDIRYQAYKLIFEANPDREFTIASLKTYVKNRDGAWPSTTLLISTLTRLEADKVIIGEHRGSGKPTIYRLRNPKRTYKTVGELPKCYGMGDVHNPVSYAENNCDECQMLTTCTVISTPPKQTSDGSTASYYELPEGAKELQDLISYRNMNAQMGEIFRACYRYGQVSHSPKKRDIKKIIFYAQQELARLEKYEEGK